MEYGSRRSGNTILQNFESPLKGVVFIRFLPSDLVKLRIQLSSIRYIFKFPKNNLLNTNIVKIRAFIFIPKTVFQVLKWPKIASPVMIGLIIIIYSICSNFSRLYISLYYMTDADREIDILLKDLSF